MTDKFQANIAEGEVPAFFAALIIAVDNLLNDKNAGRHDPKDMQNAAAAPGRAQRRRLFYSFCFIPALFATGTGGAVPRTLFCRLARCREHFARPFPLRLRAAGGTADSLIVFSDELIKFFSALRTDILQNRHVLLPHPLIAVVADMMTAAAPDLTGRFDVDGIGRADDEEGDDGSDDGRDADDQPEAP